MRLLGRLTVLSASSLMEIGQIKEERKFYEAAPFVMLNGCASSSPYVTFTGPQGFSHRFVKNSACAFVGTLWPVEETAANEFARLSYTYLIEGENTVSNALLRTKKALVKMASGEQLTEKQKVARYVAARSYCLFANPDLRLRVVGILGSNG
jgi:CHAT domain-containing protein